MKSLVTSTLRAPRMLLICALILLTAISIGYFGTSATIADREVVAQKTQSCVECVYIQRDGFSTSEIAVKEGSYIEFVTADDRRHNLALGSGLEDHASDSHIDDMHGAEDHHDEQPHSSNSEIKPHDHAGGTESGEFGPGEAWRVQFKQKGTYMVHDHLHPEHTILVVVY